MNNSYTNYPLVSVLAISYNQSKYIEEALDSIREQTYPNIQIIIIDDCSTDDSINIVEKYIQKHNLECTFIKHSENKGLCKTLNEGLKKADGSFVQMVACDDILVRNKIERHVEILRNADEKTALVCSNFSEIDEKGLIIKEQFFSNSYKFPRDPYIAILRGNEEKNITIHSPTVLVKKKNLLEFGGFDESLIQEDLYMWLNISLLYGVVYDSRISVQYRVISSSISRNTSTRSRLFQDFLIVVFRFLDNPNVIGEKREANYFSILKYFDYILNIKEYLVALKIYKENIHKLPSSYKSKIENELNLVLHDIYLRHPNIANDFYKMGIRSKSKIINVLIKLNIPVIFFRYYYKFYKTIWFKFQ